MFNADEFPQSVKDNLTNVQFPYYPGGSAVLAEFKNGLEVSLIAFNSERFEIGVGFAASGIVWEDCPLTDAKGVTVVDNLDAVLSKLGEIAEFDSDQLADNRYRSALLRLTEVKIATQFGLLHLYGIDGEEDPTKYLVATEVQRTELGMSQYVCKAIDAIEAVYYEAANSLKLQHNRGEV